MISAETLEYWHQQIDSLHELVYIHQKSIDTLTMQVAEIHNELIDLGESLKMMTAQKRQP